jgi:RNA polymerase sigma-70 factor (ECF subfamily)
MNSELAVRQFGQELTALQRRLYLYITTLIGHAADAEDVVQETNRVLWEKLDDYEPGTSLAAWAYKIAYFEVLTFRKRKARDTLRFGEDTLELLAEDAARLLDQEDARCRALRHCLAKLPESDRELITRRYLSGDATNLHQLASVFERSEKSLYRSLARIRTLLLECIQKTLAVEALR